MGNFRNADLIHENYELDGISILWHTCSMWEVHATEEYLDWYHSQTSDVQEALLFKVLLLEEFGPQLGRPHVDIIKGGSVKNLKELRARTRTHVLRVLFYFDDERQALLLVAGDKKGKNEKDFYTRLIQMAELLIKRYQR